MEINPELWTTGSFKEIARMIEQEWWDALLYQLSYSGVNYSIS
jgi:hypothetical protein